MTDILGRIGNILRANLNDTLDNAEDPEKMIDQLIRDYTNDIEEAETAVAQTSATCASRRTTSRTPRRRSPSGAPRRPPPPSAPVLPRRLGNTAEAARFDELAKAALRQQISYEKRVKVLQEQVDPADRPGRPAEGRPQRHARQAR